MKDKSRLDTDTANAAMIEIINSDPDGKLVVGRDGTILFANTASMDILDREITSLAGKKFWHPLAPGRKTEISLVKQDGSEAAAEMRVTDTRWNGQAAFLVTITDITEVRRSEAAIQQSRQKYQALFESSGDAAFVHQPTPEGLPGVFLEVNQGACALLGYTKDELLKLGPRDIVVWEKAGVTPPDIMKRLETDKKATMESAFRHKNGHEIPIEVVVHRFELLGKPAILTLARDITARKQAEEKLRQLTDELVQRNQFIQSIIDNLPIGLAINNIGDGKATYHNQKFEEIYGWPKEEIIDISTFFEKVYPDPDYRQAIINRVMTDIESGDPARMQWDDIEITTKSGEKRVISAANIPILEQRVMVSTVRDVTVRKQMEQSLAEAAEEWRTTFDSITDMVAIVDRGHKIARLNTAFANALGKSPGELIGEHCYKVIHGMNQPHPMCPHARTLETRQVESSEYFDKKLKKWVEASSSPIFDDQGNLTGSVHIIKDISDRKEAELKEQQLRDKAEMSSRLAAVGEMAAGIAHEINNPLTGVIGFSELLLGRPDIPEDMKVELKIINDGSQRVKDIVRRMLTFARQSKPVKSSVSIEELLDNTLELRSYVLKTANIEVFRDYAPDLPWVTADAGQLQQVFLNIIVNAEHAMKKAHDKGVLVVKTEKHDGHIRVLITDDGPGMPDEVKSKLFQPFFTTKDPGEGTGLGLALSMGIIQEHGGSISVNTVVGSGTTFIVELPMTPVETALAVENREAEPVQVTRRAKILVVDDERSVGALIRVIMTRQGHEVQECYGPQEALDKLADNTYDVIILDIRMPGMSGIELFDEIKVRWPEMVSRVLFITGDTSDLSTRTYLNTHNIPYISKPFERRELERKVAALL